MALIFGMEVTDRHGSMLLGVGYAWALPSMPGHDPHVPIWANFVVYEPILKISNSIGFLAFFYPNGPLGMPGHYPVCPGICPGHDPHVPIWTNFVVYEPILKISNSIGNLAFFYPNGPLGTGHYPVCPGICPFWANIVVYGPILKISNAMCISNGNLAFCDTAQLCSVSCAFLLAQFLIELLYFCVESVACLGELLSKSFWNFSVRPQKFSRPRIR